ncbi:hypothetical protein VNO77_43217 [Canavalia gladiata]|uniref:Uncharacterized protein n=1 Tax=Canavalia gladiata TaxID=3824 RepID=A0AAN9PPV0_CANGL
MYEIITVKVVRFKIDALKDYVFFLGVLLNAVDGMISRIIYICLYTSYLTILAYTYMHHMDLGIDTQVDDKMTWVKETFQADLPI